MSSQQITKFTFTLLDSKTGITTERQIWGSGGILGDHVLHLYDGSRERTNKDIDRSLRSMLNSALRLQDRNELRLFCDVDDYSKRVERTKRHRILTIRAKRGNLVVAEIRA